MTSIAQPICYGCARYRPSAKSGDGGLTCDAFPAGIPSEIVLSQVDHREPIGGDGGQTYSPTNAAAAAYAERLFTEEQP